MRADLNFWLRVQRGGDGECWLWVGWIRHDGYGALTVRGRHWAAHRLAYVLVNGEIPAGAFILHSCDERRCCNPAHLRIGTREDNTQDAIDRDRLARGERAARRGEQHGCAKLTDAAVREIRSAYAAGTKQEQLAQRFGVRQQTISRVVTKKGWPHVGL